MKRIDGVYRDSTEDIVTFLKPMSRSTRKTIIYALEEFTK